MPAAAIHRASLRSLAFLKVMSRYERPGAADHDAVVDPPRPPARTAPGSDRVARSRSFECLFVCCWSHSKGEQMKRIVLIAILAITGRAAYASDHDDNENDQKARALNLTDHFAFKSPADPSQLSLIMYFNPRSLPGHQYFLSTNAQ